MDNKETNLFDLLVKFLHWCGNIILRCFKALGAAMRLSYQHWLIICVSIVLCVSLGIYYSRSSNRRYSADIVLHINGSNHAVLKQILQPVLEPVNKNVSEDLSTANFLGGEDIIEGIKRVKAHYVIDCLRDSTIDYVDWQNKSTLTDTIKYVLPDYLALRVVTTRPDLLPTVQAALLNKLNNNSVLRANFEKFKAEHERNYLIYAAQIEKLDSLTSRLYLEEPTLMGIDLRNNSLLVGEQRRQTFAEEFREYIKKAKYESEQLALCTNPVVPVNDFALQHKAVNGRLKMIALGIVVGWLIGVALALFSEKRKKIKEYLKREV